jgi:thioredoxin-like negative regulator of GroEL
MAKELFYYTAGWCNPCQTLGPIMDEVAKQIPVRKHNVDYVDPAILAAANVKSVPTVILVENEQEVRRFSGVKSHSEIINWLNG